MVQKAGPLSPSRPSVRASDHWIPVCRRDCPAQSKCARDRDIAVMVTTGYPLPLPACSTARRKRWRELPQKSVLRGIRTEHVSTMERLSAVGPQPAHHEPSNSSDAGPSNSKITLTLTTAAAPRRFGPRTSLLIIGHSLERQGQQWRRSHIPSRTAAGGSHPLRT